MQSFQALTILTGKTARLSGHVPQRAFTEVLTPAPLFGAPLFGQAGQMQARQVLTILAVDELDRGKRFYDEAFGWPIAVQVPVYVEYALPGAMRLGIYERQGFGLNTGQVPEQIGAGKLAPTELYFHIADPQLAIARLRKAGARELSPLAPRDWGDEAAYFADPWGNVLVLARQLADK